MDEVLIQTCGHRSSPLACVAPICKVGQFGRSYLEARAAIRGNLLLATKLLWSYEPHGGHGAVTECTFVSSSLCMQCECCVALFSCVGQRSPGVGFGAVVGVGSCVVGAMMNELLGVGCRRPRANHLLFSRDTAGASAEPPGAIVRVIRGDPLG